MGLLDEAVSPTTDGSIQPQFAIYGLKMVAPTMAIVRKLAHLQSLRAVAATLVVASHALEYPIRRHDLSPYYYNIAWLLGWIGVGTFFVISGLIMIRSTYDHFGSIARAGEFIKRRVLRVVPIYWLMAAPFALTVIARGEALDFSMVLKTMLFIPYLPPGSDVMRPIIGQGWTLNYEMMFYTIFALCLCLRRRQGILLLVGLFVFAASMRVLIWPVVPYIDAKTPLQFWSDPLILLFILGVGIGLLEERGGHWYKVSSPIATSLALYGLATASFFLFDGRFPLQIGWQGALAIIAASTVTICTIGVHNTSSQLNRLMEKLGDASYSTYLVHPLILMLLATVAWRLPGGGPHPIIFVSISVIICNTAGYLTFRWIERPLGRALHNAAMARRRNQFSTE